MDRIEKGRFEHLDPTAPALSREWVLVGDYYYPKHSLTVTRSRMRGSSLIKLSFMLIPIVAGLVAWLLS